MSKAEGEGEGGGEGARLAHVSFPGEPRLRPVSLRLAWVLSAAIVETKLKISRSSLAGRKTLLVFACAPR